MLDLLGIIFVCLFVHSPASPLRVRLRLHAGHGLGVGTSLPAVGLKDMASVVKVDFQLSEPISGHFQCTRSAVSMRNLTVNRMATNQYVKWIDSGNKQVQRLSLGGIATVMVGSQRCLHPQL